MIKCPTMKAPGKLRKSPNLRVGIEFPFFDRSWLGGVSAVANLLNALSSLAEPRIVPVVIAGKRTPGELLERLPEFEILRTSLIDPEHWSYRADRIARLIIGRRVLMESWLRRNAIAVYSHGAPLGRHARIPSIGHIADFAYRHFPELYSRLVFARKDAGTRRICNEYDFLMLSSQAVEADYRRFFPTAKARSMVLNIVPTGLPESKSSIQDLMARYAIPSRYIYSPNQFWVHKNHLMIVEALARARQEGHDIHIICTGATFDPRSPGHFDAVMQKVREAKLERNFHVLGVVPYEDTIDLMRHSRAVLSASLFEGWGVSVAEANTLGKFLILSDIPVFHEHNLEPDRAHFVNPTDPDEIAGQLVAAWNSRSIELEQGALARANGRHADRVKSFARRFEDIVFAAVRAQVERNAARTATR